MLNDNLLNNYIKRNVKVKIRKHGKDELNLKPPAQPGDLIHKSCIYALILPRCRGLHWPTFLNPGFYINKKKVRNRASCHDFYKKIPKRTISDNKKAPKCIIWPKFYKKKARSACFGHYFFYKKYKK